MKARKHTSCSRLQWVCLLAVACGCTAPHGHAQGLHCDTNARDQPISTDRPSFSNATSLVPCGSLQLESGLLVSSEDRQRGYDVPEALLRYGLANKTELRFTVPDYYRNYGTSGSFVTGASDLGLGVKQALAATARGFNLTGIAALTLPTGGEQVSSHGYDPTLQIMPSQKLPDNLTLSGMVSVSWPTQDGSRNVTGQGSALLDWTLAKPIDVFFEFNGVYPSRGTPQNTVDFGALYRLTKHQQVDIRSGFGLSSAATTDRFLGIGYSIRFDL